MERLSTSVCTVVGSEKTKTILMKHLLYNTPLFSSPCTAQTFHTMGMGRWHSKPKRHSIFQVYQELLLCTLQSQEIKGPSCAFFLSQHCTKLLQLRAAFMVSSWHLLSCSGNNFSNNQTPWILLVDMATLYRSPKTHKWNDKNNMIWKKC